MATSSLKHGTFISVTYPIYYYDYDLWDNYRYNIKEYFVYISFYAISNELSFTRHINSEHTLTYYLPSNT